MRPINSMRKPFITLMTMMSVATPSAMPTKRKPGDDGDEPLAATGTQIPAGDGALECVEHGVRPRQAGALPRTPPGALPLDPTRGQRPLEPTH